MKFKKILLLNVILFLLTSCLHKKIIFSSFIAKNNKYIYPNLIWKIKIDKKLKKNFYELKIHNKQYILYIANSNGKVQSINLNSKKIIWSVDLSKKYLKIFKINKLILSGLKVSHTKCYLSTENGIIISLNQKNGKIIWWKNSILGEVLTKIIIKKNILLIYTENGILQALNKNSGEKKWIVNLGNPIFSIRKKPKPIVIYDYLIVFDDFERMTAILINTGKIIWQKYIFLKSINTKNRNFFEKNINKTPIINFQSQIIFLIKYTNNLFAINLQSKKIIWKKKIKSEIKNILIYKKNIYLRDKKDQIISIQQKNGKTIWIQKNLYKKKLIKLIIYKNQLLTGDKNGHLYLIDKNNGNIIEKNKINFLKISNMIKISKNKILIQSNNKNLYCIKNLFEIK